MRLLSFVVGFNKVIMFSFKVPFLILFFENVHVQSCKKAHIYGTTDLYFDRNSAHCHDLWAVRVVKLQLLPEQYLCFVM